MADNTKFYQSLLGLETVGPIRSPIESDLGRLIYIRHKTYVFDSGDSTPLDPGGHWEGGFIGVDEGTQFPNPSKGPLSGSGNDPLPPWNPGGGGGGGGAGNPGQDPPEKNCPVFALFKGRANSGFMCTPRQQAAIKSAFKKLVTDSRWISYLSQFRMILGDPSLPYNTLWDCIKDQYCKFEVECYNKVGSGGWRNGAEPPDCIPDFLPMNIGTGTGLTNIVYFYGNLGPDGEVDSRFSEARVLHELLKALILICGGTYLDAYAISDLDIDGTWDESGKVPGWEQISELSKKRMCELLYGPWCDCDPIAVRDMKSEYQKYFDKWVKEGVFVSRDDDPRFGPWEPIIRQLQPGDIVGRYIAWLPRVGGILNLGDPDGKLPMPRREEKHKELDVRSGKEVEVRYPIEERRWYRQMTPSDDPNRYLERFGFIDPGVKREMQDWQFWDCSWA